MRYLNREINPDDVWRVLKNIRDPQFGESIVDLGLIESIIAEGRIVTIYVNLSRSIPHCKSCVPVAWMVLRAILREMERTLKKERIKYRIVENSSGILYAEG